MDRSYWDYLFVFSPILVGHVIVPPLSYFQQIGGEKPPPIFDIIYPNIPDLLLDSKFVQSMLFDEDVRKRTTEQWLSHMLVHGSYHHMISNLAAALDFGYQVYVEFGPIGLYTCFFGGGVFAAIPSSLYQCQKETFTKEFQKLFSSYGEPYVPSMLSRYWDSLSRSVAEFSTKRFLPSKSCGSSGAVCALMGCNLILSIRDVALVVHELLTTIFYYNRNKSYSSNGGCASTSSSSSSSFEDRREKVYIIFRRIFASHQTIYKTFQIIHIVNYLTDEFNHIYNYTSVTAAGTSITPPKGSIGSIGTPTHGKGSFLELLQSRLVGHSAHVQGILFGVTFGTIFGIVIPSLQRVYNNRPSSSNTFR